MSERAQQAERVQAEGQDCPAHPSANEHWLADLLAPNLRVAFIGTAAGKRAADPGRYHAARGDRFWPTLHEVRLTPRRFRPWEARELLALGIGLSDMSQLAPRTDGGRPGRALDAERFVATVRHWRPHAIAFTGKRAASAWLGRRCAEALSYGRQPPMLPDFPDVFVLPSTSAAARSSWSIAPWHALAVWLARP